MVGWALSGGGLLWTPGVSGASAGRVVGRMGVQEISGWRPALEGEARS